MAESAIPDTQRLVDYFLSLVQIDSPSFEEHAIAELLERDLQALGLTTRNDKSGPNGTGNLIGTMQGSGGMRLAICAHMDTVEPSRGVRPSVDEGVIRSDGTTVLGADCKAGLAITIEALRTVVERNVPHGAIEVVFTYGEERGHAGSKTLDVSTLQSDMVIVADGVGSPGTVISESPSYDSFRAVIHGIAAHAGLEPEKGISAISVAADAIRLMPLGRIDESTTSNVGFIRGGTARNAVPDRVEIEGEARSLHRDKLEALTSSISQAVQSAAAHAGASADFSVTREYTGYRMDRDDPSVVVVLKAAEALGLRASFEATGGGSDANTFNERGLPSIALGIGMQQPHTLEEWITVDDLAKSAELLVAIIAEAAAVSREEQ